MNKVICPRCKREAVGWPLRRADVCSPKNWGRCIRDPADVIRKQKQKPRA